jgi:hypothetical protein
MWRIRDPTRSRPFEPVDLLTLKPGGISCGVVDSSTCWTWEHLPVSCLVHDSDVAERQQFIHSTDSEMALKIPLREFSLRPGFLLVSRHRFDEFRVGL